VEIANGRHVIDWWDDPVRYADAMSDAGAFVAWTGDNPMRKGVILCAYEWANSDPGKPIRDGRLPHRGRWQLRLRAGPGRSHHSGAADE